MPIRERNYRKNPHTATFLQVFHSGISSTTGVNYRAEAPAEEASAVNFVSGSGAVFAQPVEVGSHIKVISGHEVRIGDGFVTEKQAKWIIDIATTCVIPAGRTAESVLLRLKQGFAKSAGSQFITSYKDLPKAEREPSAAMMEAIAPGADIMEFGPDIRDANGVPAGRYAVKEEGVLKFFRVTKGKGRWAGRTFLEIQASDDRHAVRNPERRQAILKLIAANPLEAEQRYGRELGKCSRCGRTLTDETSRAYGIGPDCRNK